MTVPIIRVKNLNKAFKVGDQSVPVLKKINLEVEQGDFLIIFGPSGCGKSTLLHTVLGLEEPTSGAVEFMGQDVYLNKFQGADSEDDRSEFRKDYVGMVYQQPNWIKSLTVLGNVAFPLILNGIDKAKREHQAMDVLQTMGMANWSNYLPAQLSSGQQQKVALARALITNPKIIVADEPTGNLDFDSGQELMRLLTRLNKYENKTIVMVTHDLEYLEFARTAVKMFNGEIEGVYTGSKKTELLKKISSKRGLGGKNEG